MAKRLQIRRKSVKIDGPNRGSSLDPALEHNQPDEGGRTMPQYGYDRDFSQKIKTAQTVNMAVQS